MTELEEVKERREHFPRVLYDLSGATPNKPVHWRDVAPRPGWDVADRDHVEEALDLAEFLAESRLAIKETGDGTMYSITARGINKVEDDRPAQQPASASDTFNITGPVFGGVIGTDNTAELTNNAELTNKFDFSSVEQRIEQDGGEDGEELREALEDVRRLLESGDSMERGFLSRFSCVMEKHSWFTSAVASGLVGFGTQMVGGG